MTRNTLECRGGEMWSWMGDASSFISSDCAVALSEWVKNCRVSVLGEMNMC